MTTSVINIFTFHDHFFKIVSEEHGVAEFKHHVEDELGTRAEVEDPTDLKQVREGCASIIRGYRAEMSMPGAQP